MRPPFLPTISSNDDVSNFDEMKPANPRPHLDAARAHAFSGKHLPFIGFTYSRDLLPPER